jgi:purine-binding chemotaxis protein CheW
MDASVTGKEGIKSLEGSRTSIDEERQLVVFTLAEEHYGVDIGTVREIIRMQSITKVPKTPKFVEGVINLRGKVIPVIDLRIRFDLPSGEEDKDSRIVVLDIDGQDIGAIVDAVTEVLRIPADCVEPPSSVITSVESEYLLGIAKLSSRLIILLDVEEVLSSKEKAQLSKMSVPKGQKRSTGSEDAPG